MHGVRSAASESIRPADLLQLWQQRADFLHQYGDPNSARLWRLAAVELERALEAFGAETLTLDAAAKVSGYSPDYIRKQIAAGELPNAGRKNAPRVRRADLKAKPQGGRGRPPRPAEQDRNVDHFREAGQGGTHRLSGGLVTRPSSRRGSGSGSTCGRPAQAS